jgi:phosphoribosyl-ATP pyrophosphohydrolase/phosphoribosyl-AMP cyclohydrolase
LQKVIRIYGDCDDDTLLVEVEQIGAACHTGSHTCFFNEIVKKEYVEKNPQKVLGDVYNIILDRRENPKEGSYTNLLLEKGLDNILKKVGEENTEIIIAAKNTDHEHLKYEISDYIYHLMVLMAEKDITWEEITQELSQRK